MSLVRGSRARLELVTEDGVLPIGGLRTRRFEVTGETPDASDALGEGWRRLADCAGLRRAELTGLGVFVSEEAADAVRALALSGGVAEWRLVLPPTGALVGPFQVAALHYDAEEEGEAMFRLRLASAGPITFEPETQP